MTYSDPVLFPLPVFHSNIPTNLFEGLCGEASEGAVLYGITDLDGVAADRNDRRGDFV